MTILTGRLALRESAAEAATDLGGRDPDLADIEPQQPGAVRAHDVVALRRAPQLGRAVLGHGGQRRVRLDVALVDRCGLELALDDDIGLGEAGLDVAQRDLDALGDVRGLVGLGLDADREEIVVQHRRARPHGLDHVDDVRQHLVGHVDELERLAGDGGAGGGHGGHRVALVERLLAGHDVPDDVLVVHHHLAGRDELRRLVGEIVAGDDGLHAGQRLGLRSVDLHDACVGVRAA
jgi:hypothetical protein